MTYASNFFNKGSSFLWVDIKNLTLYLIGLFIIEICWMYHLTIVAGRKDRKKLSPSFPWLTFIMIVCFFIFTAFGSISRKEVSPVIVLAYSGILVFTCYAFYLYSTCVTDRKSPKRIFRGLGWFFGITGFLCFCFFDYPSSDHITVLKSVAFIVSGFAVAVISGKLISAFNYFCSQPEANETNHNSTPIEQAVY